MATHPPQIAEKYRVIAKRYRPQTFEEVYAQESIVTTLKNGIRSKRIGHAYLFCGCQGIGKTTLARLFAKAVNCRALSEEIEPCKECLSCKAISAGHSSDFIEIDGASNRGIDDIRSLNETVHYASSFSPYKIYLIDEVHMLTKEAFNALLKTLEEPPEHVIFLFATTESHKIPPTILSRCQRFDLRRIDPENTQKKLHRIARDLQYEIAPEALSLIAAHAEGSLRDAEFLLEQILCFHPSPITLQIAEQILGAIPLDLLFSFDRAVIEGETSFAFYLVEKLFRQGCHLFHFFEGLMRHYRTIALLQAQGPHREMLPPLLSHLSEEQLSKYRNSSKMYTPEQASHILDYLVGRREQYGNHPFTRIDLELLLLHIIQSMKRMPIERLVEKLIELKKECDQKGRESIAPPKTPSTSRRDSAQREPRSDAWKREARVVHFAEVEFDGYLKKGVIDG